MKTTSVRIIIVVVTAVILLSASVLIAKAYGATGGGVLPPAARIQGLTYGEWSAKWWQAIFALPASENPLTGATGNNCIYEKVGKVGLVMANPTAGETLTCDIPAGMMLFLDIASAECSTVEEPPFYGGTPEELRLCASSFSFTNLEAKIDGVPVQKLNQYIHLSPLFEFTLPEDNILGMPAGTFVQSVSNGAHVMLAPLSPGEHTIYLKATIPEVDYTPEMNFVINVVR